VLLAAMFFTSENFWASRKITYQNTRLFAGAQWVCHSERVNCPWLMGLGSLFFVAVLGVCEQLVKLAVCVGFCRNYSGISGHCNDLADCLELRC
jgi:hypothetical protein